jgi:predicted DNA-binding WGR domain protein
LHHFNVERIVMPIFIRHEILTNTKDGHNKFWAYFTFAATAADNSVRSVIITHWGKIGTAGQMKVEVLRGAVGWNNAVSKKKNEGYIVQSIPQDGKVPFNKNDAIEVMADYMSNLPSSGEIKSKAAAYLKAAMENQQVQSDTGIRINLINLFQEVASSMPATASGKTSAKRPEPVPEPVIDREKEYEGAWGDF